MSIREESTKERRARFATLGVAVAAEGVPDLVRRGATVWSFGYGMDDPERDEDGLVLFSTIDGEDLWRWDEGIDVIADWAPFRLDKDEVHYLDKRIVHDVTSTSVERDNLTGEERPGRVVRNITLATSHGEQRIRLEGWRPGGWSWNHDLGSGSSHGATLDSEAQVLRIALLDAADPECWGRSVYLYIAKDRKPPALPIVHFAYRSGLVDLRIGESASVITLCGHNIDGPRVSQTMLAYGAKPAYAVCGNCRRSAAL